MGSYPAFDWEAGNHQLSTFLANRWGRNARGKNGAQTTIDRRAFIIGLGASALMVLSGCATSRNRSEIDTAFADLEVQLNQLSGSDIEQLVAVATRIREQSREFLNANQAFVTEFNGQAASRSVTMEELQKLADNFDVDRQTLRNQLLHMQDELYAALPADAWPDVRDVLNRKSESITAINISES